MKRTLAEFANSCGGSLRGADRAYSGVSSDTRTIKAGELFVALRGPRFNANEFIDAAANAGAAGAVVDSPSERLPVEKLAQIVVQDTLAALQQMMDNEVKAWRAKFSRMAEEAEAGARGLEGLDEARALHEDLERAIKQASRDYNQLQFYEKDLVDELAALEKPLQNAV